MAKRKKQKKKETGEKEEIVNALKKKAMGFNLDEVVEEYVCTPEGEIKLSKRKITKKFVPPDIPAVRILLGQYERQTDISQLSEEELKEEKKRLLDELASWNEEEE